MTEELKGRSCIKCNKWKPFTEFHKARNFKTGYASQCKVCACERYRDYISTEEAQLKREEWKNSNLGKETLARNKRTMQEKAEILRKEKLINLELTKEERKRKGEETKRLYYESELRRIVTRKYRQSHKDVINENTALRRAIKLQAKPGWYEEEKSLIKFLYKTSKEFSEKTGIDYEIDHIIPLISSLVCGLHCISNLQILPAKINSSKGNKYWPDMP